MSENEEKSSTVRTIKLEPDYAAMFEHYRSGIAGETDAVLREIHDTVREANRGRVLGRLNGLLAAINMSVQCLTEGEQLTALREATGASVTSINDAFRDTHQP